MTGFRVLVMTKLAVLGAGKMGEALIGGLLASGWRKPDELIVSARRPERLEELMERHSVPGTLDNAAAAADAEVVVLAVKPQDIEALLASISDRLTPEHTVLSIVAAIPTSFIEERVPDDVPVV